MRRPVPNALPSLAEPVDAYSPRPIDLGGCDARYPAHSSGLLRAPDSSVRVRLGRVSPTLARERPPQQRRPLRDGVEWLGCGGVGVGAAEDVGVPEGGRAVLLGRWGGDRLAGA